MNKHTKLALLVMPFLAVGGYIASDVYMEHDASKDRIFQLSTYGHCDIINQKCILESGDFQLNITDEAGITQLNSTFPLDSATLFLVNSSNQATSYPLGMLDSPYYWQSATALRSLIPNQGDSYKLRVIANIKGGKYISEFYSQTVR
ncbi:hypothetical protein M0C34_08245 [Agarivorans sp. TSD2052]|uniref:hypothetical protein n=1 Tax=Agarivorans sp. TSD2052 TaxID=2937286 RepID=UPI00200FAFBD|nr:hypothetical protein [Agarivorans sp. TSD2052]UPW20243.1 hypothetical protein M0C34_08245 [Agarivorans sp. TSD2052]